MGIASKTTPGGIQTTIVDVGMNLSKINHRLYRQGMNYCVKLDFDTGQLSGEEQESMFGEDADGNPIPAQYQVFTLAENWMTVTAWKKAFEAFLNNSAEEDEAKARWYDFRVNHGWTAGGAAVGLPVQYTGQSLGLSVLSEGEHELSQVTAEDGTQYNFTFSNSTLPGQLNIINELDKQYVAKRSSGQQLADRAYSMLDEDVSEAQFDHLKNDGDTPPYDFFSLEQQHPWKLVAVIDPNGDVTKQTTGYFNAPCGFIAVVGYGVDGEKTDTLQSKVMRLTAKPGNYKGVHAEQMGEPSRVGKNEWRVK